MTLKKLTGSVLMSLFWSLFTGIIIISIGFGALIPSINKIAGPFVCAGGQFKEENQIYRVSPVEKVTTITWYCIDEKEGDQQIVNGLTISLIAGTIYGVIIFIPVFLFIIRRQRAKFSRS